MQDSTPLLHPDKFQELFDDFGAEADEVIAEFVAETDREVARLRALLAAEPVDVAAVQSVAHRLKGGCMMVGALRLQGVAMALDALGKQQAPAAELAALDPRLDEAWRQTRARLASHLPET